MIHYLTLAGRWMFSEYLEYWGRDLAASKIRILRYEDLLHETRFEPGTYVFSTIEEVAPPMERFIGELALRLGEAPRVRIFNDPQRVLRRFDLHAELWRLGRSRFRSFRVTGDLSGVRYPVFIRSERSHDGALSPLLGSPQDVETWIGRALALGRPLGDLMVVEFCETADAGGWYRKYAAFNVGGRIVPRSMNYGRNWMLKFAGNEFTLAMAEEELAYVQGNPHERELAEIFAIAGTDYGRIDYSIKDGRVQPWEINLNPTIGRGLRPSSRTIAPELRDTRERTKEAFYAQFNAAWEAVASEDPGVDRTPFAIRLDPAIVAAAQANEQRRWRTGSALLGAGVRLVKPLMKTPLRPLLRMLYQLPKRLVHGNAGPLFRVLGRRARQKSA
jgi:hypothetical protein